MSERNAKFKRKFLRSMEEQGVTYPKRDPLLSHSNALCATGRHDFTKPPKREGSRYNHKYGVLSVTVWHKGPRVKTCRQCGSRQAQATTGQWLEDGKFLK